MPLRTVWSSWGSTEQAPGCLQEEGLDVCSSGSGAGLMSSRSVVYGTQAVASINCGKDRMSTAGVTM
eukprot:1147312-Pelagomonas_calceolata.AAC.3